MNIDVVVPASGASLTVVAGAAAVPVYSDAGLTTTVTQPYALPSSGTVTLYVRGTESWMATVTSGSGAVIGKAGGRAGGTVPLVIVCDKADNDLKPGAEADLTGTYVRYENVVGHGADPTGATNSTTAIQAAIDAVVAAGGGTVFFPRGKYLASGLTTPTTGAVITFLGEGGGDPRAGTWATTQRGSILTPYAAGQPVITLQSTKRLIWRNLDLVHDRSFAADGMVLGYTPGDGVGTFWPELDLSISGFQGYGLKVIGTFWECDLSLMHVRRCGDGANDKAAIEIDCTNSASDGDTVTFTRPNVTFPRGIGFRMKSADNSASSTGPGFRRLVIDGGMFHAGLDEDHVGGANRYDADMIVLDGFTSCLITGINLASAADNRFGIRLDGTLTTSGSSRAIINDCAMNAPIYVGKCKDVTIGRNTWAFSTSAAYPEHVYVDTTATRTIIEPQVVVNDGPFAVTDLGTGTLLPTSEQFIIGANAFASSAGAPTLSRAGSRFPAWLLDSASTEQVNCTAFIPAGWRRFQVDMLWSNLGPGSGDVRWSLGYSVRTAGDLLTAGDVFFTTSTDTAPAQDVLAIKTWTSSAVTTGSGVYHFRLSRLGADAADTLGNDATFLGLRLRRAA